MANEWKKYTWTYDPISSGHTFISILNSFQSGLTQCGWELAPWNANIVANPNGSNWRYFIRTDRSTRNVWKYNGDGWDQNCGILVRYDSVSNQIRLHAFLENFNQTAPQERTTDAGDIRFVIDNTAPNNYLVRLGEDGLYVEVGRDGINNNLGHGMVSVIQVIPEFYGTKEAQIRWTTQGICMDFSGEIRFTQDRNQRFVVNDGSNHNITANLAPYVCRGTNNVQTQSIVLNQRYFIGPRDLYIGLANFNGGGAGLSSRATFGNLWGAFDERYRISPMLLVQDGTATDFGTSDGTSNNARPPYYGFGSMMDYRNLRQIARLATIDHTLLNNSLVQDLVSTKYYRVARVEDNGRYFNVGIEEPATAPISVTV